MHAGLHVSGRQPGRLDASPEEAHQVSSSPVWSLIRDGMSRALLLALPVSGLLIIACIRSAASPKRSSWHMPLARPRAHKCTIPLGLSCREYPAEVPEGLCEWLPRSSNAVLLTVPEIPCVAQNLCWFSMEATLQHPRDGRAELHAETCRDRR